MAKQLEFDIENKIAEELIREIVKKATLNTLMIFDQKKNPGIETEGDKFIRDVVYEEIENYKSKIDRF